MEKEIIYCGQKTKVGCDEKCNKAWGLNTRPKEQLSDDWDDYAFLSDGELGDAPIDPQTYEGGHGKPEADEPKLNKWCVRECERCTMSNPNDFDKPLKIKDFSKRRYNIHAHDPSNI